MQSRNRLVYQPVTTSYKFRTNPWSVSTTNTGYSVYDTFSFSGFGKSGTRPPYIIPVPGEYIKEYREPQKGRDNVLTKSYGQFYEQTIKDGALSNGDWGAYYGTYDGTVYNECLSKFYDAIYKTESNLALTIGEAKETAKMLQVGRSIFEVLQTARRAKRQFLMNPSKSLSQIWLSYKYGWQPLLSDIWGYLNWNYHTWDGGVPVRARRTRRSIVSERRYINNWQYAGCTINNDVRGSREWKCEINCTVGLSNSDWFTLQRITSLNPLSIAWELVPLSFVADWFIDVGGYLQNMERALSSSLTFKHGYVTEVYAHRMSAQWTGSRAWPSGTTTYDWLHSSQGYHLYARKRRTKLTGFPIPRAPRLNLRLGWQRMFSAAALIRTILLGKVSGRRF